MKNTEDKILTKQDYHADLITFKNAITTEFESLKSETQDIGIDFLDKKIPLRYQISVVTEFLNNLDIAYQSRIQKLYNQACALESFHEQVPQDLLSKTKVAIVTNNKNLTGQLLQEIGQYNLKNKAEYFYLLGNIAEGQIDPLKALSLFECAVKLDPSNSTYLDSVGSIAHDLAQYEKAIQYYKAALASDIASLGLQHPQVAVRQNNLGVTWVAMREYDKAIDCYEKALVSDINTFGENHPDVATDQNNLGGAWKSKGQYNKAIEYYEMALANHLVTLGKNHPQVASDYNNLGSALHDESEYDKAIYCYERALASDITSYGKEHPQVATSYNNLGCAWQDKGEYERAIESYEKAFNIFVRRLGSHHPNTLLSQENFSFLLSLKSEA